MANRDYDDRDWDRGQRDHYGQDDRGYGRQSSQWDDRSQGRSWEDRSRGGWGDGSRGQWTGGPGFSRGGMSQSGGAYPRPDASEGRGRQDFGQTYGQGYDDPNRGYDTWRASGPNYGSRQSQADMGYAGFGDRRYGGSEAGRADPARGGRGQGGDLYGDRAEDRSRYDEDRFGRSRGSMGGAFGEGRRDYSDYRSDRDRSLLGDIAHALGFGSDRARDDRADRGRDDDWRAGNWRAGDGDRSASWQAGDRPRGLGPKGYTRSDSRIEEDVNERLSQGAFDASDVEVTVKDGEVTLSGSIRSRQDKRQAEDLADDVSGVRHVQNNLRVKEWSSEGSGRMGGAAGSQASGYGSSGTGSATNVTTGQSGSQSSGQSGSQSGSQLGAQTAQSGASRSEPNKF